MKKWMLSTVLASLLLSAKTTLAACDTNTPWGCANEWITGFVPDVVEVRENGSIYFTKNGIGGNSWFKLFAGSDNVAVKNMLATLITSRSTGMPLNIYITGAVPYESFAFSVSRIQL